MEFRFPRRIFFIFLAFFLLRNLILCIILPPWSFGDEIANFDYILKLGQGQIPSPSEFIEEELYVFHKENYDMRYVSSEKSGPPEITNITDLGLAAFSYQAYQPPLAYLIYSSLRKIFLLLSSSMRFQVIILRIIALAAVGGGVLLIFFGLIKQKIKNKLFYISLIFITLLAQDMYFSINIDVFAFLFSCLVINRILALYRDPNSNYQWFFLALAVALSMWVKITGIVMLFVFPLLVILLFSNKEPRMGKIRAKAAVFSLMALLLGAPWYIINQIRFGNPLRYLHFSSSILKSDFSPQRFSLQNIINFFRALFRTLFRGEFIWKGTYFDVMPQWLNEILLTVIPLTICVLGLYFVIKLQKSKDGEESSLTFLFAILGFIIISIFFIGNFTLGHLPYYHARMAFPGLYFIVFSYAAGWQLIFRRSMLAFYIPTVWLIFYNLIYSINLLSQLI